MIGKGQTDTVSKVRDRHYRSGLETDVILHR